MDKIVNSDIECSNCKSSIRIRNLIKLKDRFCCPRCFTTLTINDKKKRDDNNVRNKHNIK